MIKITLFQDEYCTGEWVEIDRLLNGFIRAESINIEVIDIKYNSLNTMRTHNTALRILRKDLRSLGREDEIVILNGVRGRNETYVATRETEYFTNESIKEVHYAGDNKEAAFSKIDGTSGNRLILDVCFDGLRIKSFIKIHNGELLINWAAQRKRLKTTMPN